MWRWGRRGGRGHTLTLNNELMFLTEVQGAESFFIILTLEQWGLVALQDFRAGRAQCQLLGLSAETASQMFPAAQTGEILGVGQTDVQWEVTLGSVDIAGVCQADLHLQVILGFVAQPPVRVLAPGPALRILYRVGWVLGLKIHEHRAAPHQAGQNTQQRQLERSSNDWPGPGSRTKYWVIMNVIVRCEVWGTYWNDRLHFDWLWINSNSW